jgi:hypothetical protein
VNRLNRSTTSIGCPGLASATGITENYTSNALGDHQGTLVKSYSYDAYGQATKKNQTPKPTRPLLSASTCSFQLTLNQNSSNIRRIRAIFPLT